MKPQKLLLFILLIILTGSMAFAQNDKKQKDTVSILSIDHFQFRNTFDENAKKPSPAQIQFTLPDNKPGNWVLNAGISYKIKQTKTFTSKLVTEFHLNTLVDKQQE